MSVMLTGGAGFVGLNVAELLLNDGHDVVVYGLEAPSERFMKHVADMPGQLSTVIGDVRDRDAVRQAMAAHGVDRVVHGAAVTAGRSREATGGADVVSVNVIGAVEVLEACSEHGVRRVVQLGTGSIYGMRADVPGVLDEVDDPPVPDSLYGITKYAAERIGLRYRSTRDLDLVVARLANVFGRWEYPTGKRDTLSIPYLLMQHADRGEHAIVGPDLPQDWVYALDVASAIVGLLFKDQVVHDVLHVGTGTRWSVETWCEKLREEFPEFSYEFVDQKDRATVGRETPNRRAPFSIERLRSELSFTPRFMLPEALADYSDWWRQSRDE
ncbi:NAD-dependent epimerase/dehydratase family protein [Mycobacterium sp. SMC-4]|uniref:NAD-dependent epimerase/dehydratase family protein n=1 Tax=Mycobacterium sp. SMC-4 TaxID=2857059 RepID=UPI003CFDCA42